jgi:hypothetical protein
MQDQQPMTSMAQSRASSQSDPRHEDVILGVDAQGPHVASVITMFGLLVAIAAFLATDPHRSRMSGNHAPAHSQT